jgi:hypothetical protein
MSGSEGVWGMNQLKRLATAGMAVLMLICTGYTADNDSAATMTVKLKPSGFASMQVGQIVKGGINSRSGKVTDGALIQNLTAGLSLSAALSERDSLGLGFEIQMYNNYPIISEYAMFRYQYFYAYLSQAAFSHVFGDTKTPYLTLTAGYFPEKYNKDSRNLGEYLFRTGTYPQYILTNFDFSMARLMGVRANYKPIDNLTIEGILYSNVQWYAVGDWNLAAIANYNISNIVEIGIGGCLNSIVSANSDNTTPRDPATLYHIKYNATTGARDSSFYTFKGSKIIAKLAVDAKELMPWCKANMGKEDLKLYSEAAILGLKDYPENLLGTTAYDSILDRIPIMVGFNIPTFKILDVLSCEVEWFGNKYDNDIGGLVIYGTPLSGGIGVNGNSRDRYKHDNWKWSIYGTKKIGRNYLITGQVASDHMHPLAVNAGENVDYNEALHNTNEFYYMLKMTAGF